MKKKILLSSLIILSLFSGCKKSINEYDKINTGIITGKYYQSSYAISTLIPVYVGDTTVYQPHITYYPEQYNVECRVNDEYVHWDNKEIYDKYKVGDEVTVIIHYKEYDDGEVFHSKPVYAETAPKDR